MERLEVKNPSNNEINSKREERGFFKKKIEKSKLESKETETDKQLQEFDKQGDGIVHKAKDLTKEGLKGYLPFSAIGIYDSSKRDISDDEKQHDERIRYMNNSISFHCRQDMENMIKEYKNHLKGFREATDLCLEQMKLAKQLESTYDVKNLDSVAKLVESLKDKSTRAEDVQEESNSIRELIRSQQSSSISTLMPDRGLGGYLEKAKNRKTELENTKKALEAYYAQHKEGEKDIFADKYKEFQIKIDKAITEEEAYHKILNDICNNPNKLINDNKKEEIKELKNCAQNVQKAEQDLDRACEELCNVLPGNLLNSALDHLAKMHNKNASDQIKDMNEQGEACLYFHPSAGKIILDGVFWPMARIEDLKPNGKDKTKMDLDTNRANLVIETSTEHGLQRTEKPYVKTLSNEFIDVGNTRIRFVTPFAGGTQRPEAKLIIQRRNANGGWDEESPQDINLATLRTIRIHQHFTKTGEISVTVHIEDDVKPDVQEFLHEKYMKTKPGFDPEKAQRMYKIHLPSQSIIFPNGHRMTLEDAKWNAVRDDGDGVGPKIRVQGPTVDDQYLSLLMLGYDLQSNRMSSKTKALNAEIDKNLSHASELLKDAFSSKNEDIIKSTLCHVENTFSRNMSQLALLKNAYRDAPKSREHKAQDRIEVLNQEVSQLDDFLSGGKEIYKATKSYGEKLNEIIQGNNYSDNSEHRNVIEKVCHLKETFKVEELLEDQQLEQEIQEIARQAGEAARIIEEVKSPGTAKQAQIDAENTIIKGFIKACDEYRKNKSDESLEAFHDTLQKKIFQYNWTLQAKAEIIKNTKKYANAEENKINLQNEKKTFTTRMGNAASESEKAKIIQEQKKKAKEYIEKKDLENLAGAKSKKIDKYQKEIDKEVEIAIKGYKDGGDSGKHKCAVEAAIRTAWMLEKYGMENKEKISKAAEKAKIGANAIEKTEYEQYECAVEAAIKTGFKLAIYENDQKEIGTDKTKDVDNLVNNAKKELKKGLKDAAKSSIEEIINKYAEQENNDEIREKLNRLGKKIEEGKSCKDIKDIYEKCKYVLKTVIEEACEQKIIEPAIEGSAQELVNNAEKKLKKGLKNAERSIIEAAWKMRMKPEDEDEMKGLVENAHKRIDKAKGIAEANAENEWNNDKKRGNIVAEIRLNEIEEEVKEKIETKEKENKKNLSELEKEALRMRIIVEKAYVIKDQVGGGEIAGIPSALMEETGSADELKKKAEEWVSKLRESSQTRRCDGAELMQEQRRLKSYAKDPSDDLSLAERCNHLLKRAKLEQIEDIIDNDQRVHYSYRVMLNMARIYEAALDDSYFGTNYENKGKIEGALDYLDRVKTEGKFHDNELGKLREDFLGQVVKFVRSGMKAAKDRQANRILLPFVVRAHRVLEADLDNLELVKQVLNSNPADAKEIKDKLNDRLSAEGQRSALGLDEIRHDIEKIAKDIGEVIEDRLMKNGRFDFGELEKLRPSEKQAWRDRLQQKFRKNAEAGFEAMLNSLNSEQRAIMERNRADLIDKMIDRACKDYQKTEAMDFQLYKIRSFAKEVDKQRWKDVITTWFLLFMQNATQSSNSGANTFLQQIEKILKESV